MVKIPLKIPGSGRIERFVASETSSTP